MIRRYSFLFVAALFCGCGRYLPPIYPEQLVPEAVKEVTVTSEPEGVLSLTWLAPDKDLRGKKLKELEGYSVRRWSRASPLELTDRVYDLPFQELAFLEDHHVEKRIELEKDAEEKGQITRKVKVSDDLLKFSYQDKTVPQGTSYYIIVPVNQKGGEGKITNLYKVTRAQNEITVTTLPYRLERSNEG